MELDKIRALRLLAGRRSYLEVGTRDKSNLRYVSSLLAPGATVVDVDIAPNSEAAARLRGDLGGSQIHHEIVGDSSAAKTVEAVKALAPEDGFEGVFIDANHVAAFVLSDFAHYGELVARDGYIFFHDARWEGNETAKGVAHALDILQRQYPVYQIVGAGEVSHFFPPLRHGRDLWGGVAIVRGADVCV